MQTPKRRLNQALRKKKREARVSGEECSVPPSQRRPKKKAKKLKPIRRKPTGPASFEFRGHVIPAYSGGGSLDGHAFYPLTSPGMPLPGPDMLELAAALGDSTVMKGKPGTKAWGFDVNEEGRLQIGVDLERLMCEALYSAGTFQLPVTVKGGRKREMPIVTGHPWARSDRIVGPCANEVMVLGKCLGEDEVRTGRCYAGRTGELLLESCEKLGIRAGTWYMTNVLKIEPPEDRSGELKKPWVREFLPLLHQELKIVRPRFILCLGADASKTLLGRHASVKSMEGRLIELTYPVHFGDGHEELHTALVMCLVHPAAVLRAPDLTEKFENGLARFGQLVAGHRWDQEELDLDHFNVDTIEGLLELEQRIHDECENNLVGIDAEWHGDHPQNKNAYVRTIQLSWKAKTAACVILKSQGGVLRMHYEAGDPREDHQGTAIAILKRILKGRRIAGHFLNSDLEWLVHLGLDVRKQFHVAPTWKETMNQGLQAKPQGGFDTGIACHSVDETGDFALTSMALRFTSAPRYDHVLNKWRRDYCSEHKLKAEELEGYGECPDDVLHPGPDSDNPHYACYDADVVWRMVEPLQNLLNRDHFGNNCWEAFWMTMRALPGILEMNTTGIPVDHDRLEQLTLLYHGARTRLEREIQEWARWPELNLNSVYQVREFLFGEQYNGKELANEDDPPIRLRPEGARSLHLDPILTTGKRQKRWSMLSFNEMREATPSTNKTSLSILAQESTRIRRTINGRLRTLDLSGHVNKLRDFRFISQVLKSVLRVPAIDDDGEMVRNEAGHFVYPGGLPAAICDDDRVRSHGYPTKETGRWAFSRPPMQNFAKRREADYKRILREDYRWPLRTLLCAPPGYVLVESDYKGAELYGMALMSGDRNMLDHAKRNLLPEYHPKFYDIHSSIAVQAFNYNCLPTKGGLTSIDKKHMRIVAKSVIFGVAYGRGAKAIALAAKEEGVEITEFEAQQVIDAIFAMYPDLQPFFEACRRRSSQERWMCDAFGRFRRFPHAPDFMVQGEFERQAMNFPIQAMVANAVARAVDHLYHYRDDYDDNWKDLYLMVLAIHDAVLMLVPYENVPWVADEVMPECMTNRVPIFPSTLEGMPIPGKKPHYLGLDTEVMLHWGEKLSPGQCDELGFSPRYGGWHNTSHGWVDVEDKRKIWRKDGFVKPGDGEYDEALQELAAQLK